MVFIRPLLSFSSVFSNGGVSSANSLISRGTNPTSVLFQRTMQSQPVRWRHSEYTFNEQKNQRDFVVTVVVTTIALKTVFELVESRLHGSERKTLESHPDKKD